MIQNYIYIAVFASFPEALFILLLGFNLSNVKNIKISKLLIVAFFQSIISLFTRVLNVNFGVHTIIQIISLYLLVILFFKIKYYKAIITVLIGSLSQGLIQSIILPLINNVWEIEFTNLYYDPISLILGFIPVSIASIIVLIIIKRNNLVLYDISG